MVKTTAETLGGVDAAILVVEAREEVGDIEASLISRFKSDKMKAILVINKVDTVTPSNVAKTIMAYSKEFDFDAVIPLSAKNGKGIAFTIPISSMIGVSIYKYLCNNLEKGKSE